MRTVIAAGVLLVMLQASASAFLFRSPNAPWCVEYSFLDGAIACDFFSFQQCEQSRIGVGGYCFRNPWTPRVDRSLRSSHGRYRY